MQKCKCTTQCDTCKQIDIDEFKTKLKTITQYYAKAYKNKETGQVSSLFFELLEDMENLAND